MSAFDVTLLPRSARVEPSGRASIGGCDLAELADRYGTPLYVYDEDELRLRARRYVDAFGEGNVAFAGKAALFGALVRIIDDEGLALDVASGGELHLALASGFDAQRVVFHGNNKSTDELRAALAAGIGRIVVDSFDELDRLDELTRSGYAPVSVLVRVTPGVSAHTHEHIDTGVEDSKFGFSIADGAASAAVERIGRIGALRLDGLHCHIGSQIVLLDAYTEALRKMAPLVAEVEQGANGPISELSIGGGLAVRYVASDVEPSVATWARLVREGVERALDDAGARARPRITVEPGRSIAGPAAVTLYRVGTIKRVDARTYVAVDGGMSDNARPITYGARYDAFVAARADAPRELVATVAGKHCEQGDLLVRDGRLPADTSVGEVLAVPCTGAYAYSMASNYNRLPRPAVVMVRGGRAELAVRRESYDDLTARDVVASADR